MVLMDENDISDIFKAEKEFILNGSLSLVGEKSNDSNVIDIKLDINGEFFPSIITVSNYSYSKKIFFDPLFSIISE